MGNHELASNDGAPGWDTPPPGGPFRRPLALTFLSPSFAPSLVAAQNLILHQSCVPLSRVFVRKWLNHSFVRCYPLSASRAASQEVSHG